MYIAYMQDHDEPGTDIIGVFTSKSTAVAHIYARITESMHFDNTVMITTDNDTAADIVHITYDVFPEWEWFVEPVTVFE